MSRKDGQGPKELTPQQAARREDRRKARAVVAAQLTGAVNYEHQRLNAFISLSFLNRLVWLVLGPKYIGKTVAKVGLASVPAVVLFAHLVYVIVSNHVR